MKNFFFNMPTSVEFGIDIIEKIGQKVNELGKSKALIITDKGIISAGLLENIKKSLQYNDIAYDIFDEVESDPGIQTIEKGVTITKGKDYDILIAVGGGSSIDTAKSISILITNGGRIKEYAGVNKVLKKGMPLIAVPTTAGTGSEVTTFAVLSDLENNLKFTISSRYLAPQLAILDPSLTITLPSKITAATGMDALTHAIEAYTSLISQSPANALALYAIKLILKYLPKAVANGEDLVARTKMLEAQLMAGIAFNNALLGLSHAIASPLGAHFHIPHGIANAIMLPYVMEYNLPACKEKFAEIARLIIDKNPKSFSEAELAYETIQTIKKLAKEIEMPQKLREVGVKEEGLKKVAKDVLKSGMLKFNARKADEIQILGVLKKAF